MQLTSTLALLAATSNALASSLFSDDDRYYHNNCSYVDHYETCRELVYRTYLETEAEYRICLVSAYLIETEKCGSDKDCKGGAMNGYFDTYEQFECTKKNDCKCIEYDD